MKKIFIPLVALLGLAACTGNDTPVVNEESEGALSVSISLPQTRVEESYSIATAEEVKVTTLNAYLFNKEGNYVKTYADLLAEEWTPASPAEAKVVTLEGIGGNGSLLFVANAGETASLQNVPVTKAAFLTMLTDELTTAPQCPLLMTAEADIENWMPGSTLTLSAELKRVVARIDVRVWEDAGFTLTKADLRDASKLSYLFPNTSDFAPCDKLTLSNASPAFVDAERKDPDFGPYTDKLYKALFYLYSAPAAQMTLRLYGTQQLGDKSAEAVYDIPLGKIFPEGTNIDRNNCYTLVVKDVDVEGGGSFNIDVDFNVGN